jgi:hypothetical protein
MRTVFPSVWLAAAACTLLAGCDGPTDSTPRPAQVAAVSSETLQGVVGAPAGELVVRVTDADGDPIRGVPVEWTAAAGTLTAAAARTDRKGEVRAMWTLGPAAGLQTATVRVEGLEPVTFQAGAAPGLAVRVEPILGDGQTGWVHTTLDEYLSVRAKDAYGNPVAGATIRWSVVGATDGVGGLSQAETVTASNGAAEVRWTLGGAAGEQSARAALPDAPSATGAHTFRATALADVHAPVLRGVTFSPAVVDVTNGPAQVQVTLHVTDVGSGTEHIHLDLESPTRSRFATCTEPVLASGTPHDGHWMCTATIPQRAEPGPWTLGMVLMMDRSATESLAYSGSSGPALQVETRTEGPVDAEAPELASLSFSPSTVTLGPDGARVQVSLRITDAGAGVDLVQFDLESPSYVQPGPPDGELLACHPELAGGTRNDGVWSCTVVLDGDAEAGMWRPGLIILVDRGGNERTYHAPPGLPTLTVQAP